MDSSSFLTENTEIKWYPQRIIAVQMLTACVTLTPSHSRSHFPVIKQSVLSVLALLSPTQLIWAEFPFQIHQINCKMHHQEKSTAMCSSNLLTTLNSAVQQVFGNWFAPSQLDLFSSSALHFFHVSFRRGFQKPLEYVRPGEES